MKIPKMKQQICTDNYLELFILFPSVYIYGPRQSGKTTAVVQFLKENKDYLGIMLDKSHLKVKLPNIIEYKYLTYYNQISSQFGDYKKIICDEFEFYNTNTQNKILEIYLANKIEVLKCITTPRLKSLNIINDNFGVTTFISNVNVKFINFDKAHLKRLEQLDKI